MKVIVSHDVDHITAWEHKSDLILPKHIIRNFVECGLRYISPGEVIKRSGDIIRNKWNNLESVMQFDREQGVPATFFFGVENGVGLSYALRDAAFWIRKTMENGFYVGVHGIAYERPEDIRKEYDTFADITGHTDFGIRMHYLRRNSDTLRQLDLTGYGFDSSFPEMNTPYKIGGLWEFPVHIMDGQILCRNARWQNQTLDQTKETSRDIIKTAAGSGVEYLTLVLHDRYFSDSFRTWKEWYIWLIGFLKEQGFGFISYPGAIKELETRS